MISLALLEVMDKEPSLPGIWIGAAVFGGVGFWSARRWVWPGLLFLAWEVLGLWGTHAELTDRFVGPAILQEAGRGYVMQSYVAAGLSIAATAAGLAWGILRWQRRRAVTAAPGALPPLAPPG
jgi:hypothetical protein